MRFGFLILLLAAAVSCTRTRPASREDQLDPLIATPANLPVRQPLRAPLKNWDHVVTSSGNPPRILILGREGAYVAWNAQTGERIWKSSVPRGSELRFAGMDGDQAIVLSPSGRVYWIATGSGNLMKDDEIEGDPGTIHLGTIFTLLGQTREVSAWNRVRIWKKPIEFEAKSVEIQGQGSFVVVTGELAANGARFLQVLDLSTGRLAWKLEISDPLARVTPAEQLALIAAGNSVTARNLATGAETWTAEGREVRVRLDKVLIRDASGYVTTVDLATGERVSRELKRQAIEFADAVEDGGIRYEVHRRESPAQCWMVASDIRARVNLWTTTSLPCAATAKPKVAGALVLIDLGDGLRVYPTGR